MDLKFTEKNRPETALEWTPQRVFSATLFIAGALLGLWLIYYFRSALVILLVAIMLGTGLKPVLNWLGQRGISASLSKVIIFLLIIVLIFTLIGLALPILVDQATNLSNQFSEYYTDMRALMINSPSAIMRGIGLRLSARLETEDLATSSQSGASSQSGQSPAQNTVNQVASSFHSASLAFNGILAFLAIFLLAFYWTIEGERVIRSLLLLVPANQRDDLQEMITAIEGKLGGFLLGQFLLCLVIGGFTLIAYLIIGLPNALILAIIAGILEAVPVIGPALGAIPALAVAVALSPEKVIFVLLATVVIQLLENNFLVPHVMNHAVGVHPFFTLLSLAMFSSILGIGGALLAVPLAAIFQYLINQLVFQPLQEPTLGTDERDYNSFLQLKATELTRDLRHQDHKMDDEMETLDPIREQIEAVVDDLVQILKQQDKSA